MDTENAGVADMCLQAMDGNPCRREAELVAEQIDGETVVYVRRNHTAHALAPPPRRSGRAATGETASLIGPATATASPGTELKFATQPSRARRGSADAASFGRRA